MFRTLHSSLVAFLMIWVSTGCAQDLQGGAVAGAELRSLYSVSWNTDQTRVSVLAPGSVGGADEADDSQCKNGAVNGAALVCPDRLVRLATGDEAYFPYALRGPRGAALGEFDRIAYVLDRSGDLHVMDTGWSATASDDLPLLLWTPGGDHVDLVAGNAKRQLAAVELMGGMKRWAVGSAALYVLYQNRVEEGWSWGVERVSLVDYRSETMQPEQVVSNPEDVPGELRITEEGHVKIYRDGAVLAELSR
jgi:hypothetical protein